MEKKEDTEGKTLPEKKFSTGAICATIWKNNGTTKTGEPSEFRTIKIERRYKDKEDNWQSTNSLRVGDLPKAALVLNKAYEHIVLKQELESQIEAVVM
ncbi:MAG: hypothetical protein QF824_00385 [Candidatus Woesearchaeota archaeon]|jgi:hypothetical protein|nr:hypothetical protein [Candidatus Woesearchaeota archaeon]|tara:strand:- start:362 stop:655 length:294 start_codon:yes stop_codon:yes gene_type:complete